MHIVTTTADLADATGRFSRQPFVAVDTEFLRESTFWPELCLIQMAASDFSAIVDPLAPGIDLAPFFDLMADDKVTKVFHAARQDIEIVFNMGGLIPQPVFDTQVAAMVCGYGDSISYDQLVFRITGERIDKSSRFTDWKRRPLSERQLDYALADVTHLCKVYQAIKANLEEQGRADWVAEEMDILTSQATYDMPPADAWKRLKLRVRRPREFALLRMVAEWREIMARRHDVPRGRVIKDEAIYEICAHPPKGPGDLMELRGLARGFDRGRFGADLLAVVRRALELPKPEMPDLPQQKSMPEGGAAATEMLKVLLKLTVEKHGVAAKVIATVEDLERIADDDNADVPALSGWRRELFGQHALALKHGDIALGFDGRNVSVIAINGAPSSLVKAAE